MERTRLEDRYELGEVLGRGGMGVVYKARDRLMGREVALKTILDVENNVALDLFYKECSIQSRIVHPNIVEVYDVGEFVDTDGITKPFYVMPLLPGVTLSKLIADGSSRLTIERAIEIIRSACRGLEAAHENGLIHRDLKPGNLFVMKDDSVKLIDFGIAFVLGAGTKTLVKGTLHYMAPELMRMKQPTAMSDVYSLAIVCYQTLCRRLPFEGLSEGALTDAILNRIPPAVSEVNPAIPLAVSQVLHKAMAKQPWHRFGRAKEFGEMLGEALRNGAVQLYDTAQLQERLQRAAKAYEEGDYEFASEVVRELDAEGVLDPQLTFLRKRVEQADRHGRIQKLLSAAQRFRDAGEAPVALRKVQEALELDPEDTGALALQSEIERQRREQQIGDWFRLAREHLANHAFERAHEAIGNVLKVKPNETQALEFRNEIERIQQEVERDRERKEQIYQTALKAWNKGDVTHALTRLEDLIALERDRPDSEGGRGATYQKLYQEVRSEHESIDDAHKQAIKHLSEDRLAEGEKVCDQFLAKYPSNALFQSLKFDIEERRRQKLSEAIAETDRRVEQEPDLKRKLGILEEVIERYPGEPHFERALNLVREKYNLVEAIVAKARFHEENSQWTEALTQWRMLKSIDPGRPGLQYEIERIEKERERHAAAEAKQRSITEIDELLEAGDAERAIEKCQAALEEVPDDPEISELLKLAEKKREKVSQAKVLLEQARTALDAGNIDEGLDLLREANRRDDRNRVIKAVFVHTLVEKANALADSDWQRAAVLVDEVNRQEPQHPALQGLRKKLETYKKQQFVDQFVDRARVLQSAGSLDEARQVVEKAIALYPGEAALTQLLATLKRAVAERASETTPQPRAEPPNFAVPEQGPGPATLGPATLGQATPGQAPPEPAAFGQAAHGEPVPGQSATQASGKEAAPAAAFPSRAEQQPPPPEPPRPMPQPPPPLPEPPPQSSQQQPPAPPKAGKARGGWDFPIGWKPAAALFGGVVLGGLLLALGISWMTSSKPEAPPVAATPAVHLSVVPAAAAIAVNGKACGVGNCELTLEAGSYQATARLAGYEPAQQTFVVGGDPQQAPPPVELRLEPRMPALYISSNRPRGTIQIDDEQVGELSDGQFELPELPAGEHVIRVHDGATDARLRISVDPAQAPQVLEVSAVNARVTAASSVGRDVRLYADREGLPVAIDGNAVEGQAGPGGLHLDDVGEGWHDVLLGPDDSAASLAFEAGMQPSLSAVISADLPTGVLYVVAGEDGATVVLNGKPYTRRKTYRGRLRIDPMPGELRVRVEKPGFQPSDEKTVTIRKGRTSRVEFTMAPQPKMAGLRLVGGVPGATVWMGGKQVGTVGSNGTIELAGLDPGTASVELRREGYRSKTIGAALKAGETAEVEASMARANGTLMIALAPPGVAAKITLRPQGGAPREVQPGSLSLSPGSYVVEAAAEGYEPARQNVEIQAGTSAAARLELRQKAVAPKGPVDYLPVLLSQEGWSPQADRAVRKGGGFVYFPVKPQSGVYRFTVSRMSGDRVHWFFRFGEEQDHWFYELGKRHFERIRVRGNKRTREARYDRGVDRNEPFEVVIEVEPAAVTTRIVHEGQVIARDQLTDAGAFPTARWGFWLGNGDQIAIAAFSFEPH